MPDTSAQQPIDWNDAFDNGSYVAGSAGFPEQWARAAGQYRTILDGTGRCTVDIAYGEHDRQRLDLFTPPGDSRGLVIFVHGGYWHKFDKSYWSHLSAGCLAEGWSVAVPGYRLAPDVSITQITRDISQAIDTVSAMTTGPVCLAGHSAGGHLVARMLCEDDSWSQELQGRLARVVAISGIYDLRPLLLSSMNDILQLDAREAVAESPALQVPSLAVPLLLWVGDEERPEFLRQTRLMCEKWSRLAAPTSAWYEKGKNHFSVIDALSERDSPLVQAITGGL